MSTDENLKKTKEIIEDFFNKMTISAEIENQGWNDNFLKVGLISSEAQVLIGSQGKTLLDIQAILAKIIRKKLGEEVFLDLDVNGYKSDKEQRFRDLAQDTADEVVSSGREKVLFPMNAFERRIIHTELAKRNDITTQSIGEGDERKVVVTPA